MTTDSFIYKFLDIEYNTAELENFYKNTKTEPRRFMLTDVKTTLQQLPSIAAWFNQHGLIPRTAAYISIPSNSIQMIHQDSGTSQLAINFPVHNCEKNLTHFYSIDATELKRGYTIGTNLPYEYYSDEATKIIVGTLSLTKPCLLNIKVPHSVVNVTDDSRLSLSFRFKEDPWFLVN